MPTSHICGGSADGTRAPAALQVGHVRLRPSRAMSPIYIYETPLVDILHPFVPSSGRILMETPRPPTIIPMWITGAFLPSTSHLSPIRIHTQPGFDKLMPEGRHAPWKYLPRPGARLSVTFGTPVSPAAVYSALGTMTRDQVVPRAAAEAEVEAQRRKDRDVRIALTDVVQHAVEALGRQVSGDLLTGPGSRPQPPLPPPLKRT